MRLCVSDSDTDGGVEIRNRVSNICRGVSWGAEARTRCFLPGTLLMTSWSTLKFEVRFHAPAFMGHKPSRSRLQGSSFWLMAW
jgi:hypothetical protein